MEFLLVSQRKHRTWVMLKQLLLLLLRIAGRRRRGADGGAAAGAQPVGQLLGSTKTHHVVLLDDSFSMSDRWDDTDAFAEAKAVVERIGAAAARESQHAKLSRSLRFSRVGTADTGVKTDLLRERIDRQFPADWRKSWMQWRSRRRPPSRLPPLRRSKSCWVRRGERRISI